MPSIKTEFGFNDDDFNEIQQSIKRLGYSSEEVINDYLHNIAGKDITESITHFIPVAKVDKTHKRIPLIAKNSIWSEQENFNLAVGISNSLKGKRGTSFYYLYYVVTGTGTSKYKGPRDFMSKGLNQEYDNVVDGLINELEKNIDKEMKI